MDSQLTVCHFTSFYQLNGKGPTLVLLAGSSRVIPLYISKKLRGSFLDFRYWNGIVCSFLDGRRSQLNLMQPDIIEVTVCQLFLPGRYDKNPIRFQPVIISSSSLFAFFFRNKTKNTFRKVIETMEAISYSLAKKWLISFLRILRPWLLPGWYFILGFLTSSSCPAQPLIPKWSIWGGSLGFIVNWWLFYKSLNESLFICRVNQFGLLSENFFYRLLMIWLRHGISRRLCVM